MTTPTLESAHTIAPEQIMAYVDGELSTTEAEAIVHHLQTCPNCARLADDLRDLNTQMQRWNIEPAPERLDAIKMDPSQERNHRFFTGWRLGVTGSAILALLLIAVLSVPVLHSRQSPRYQFTGRMVTPEEQSRVVATALPPPPPAPPVVEPEPKVPPSAGLSSSAVDKSALSSSSYSYADAPAASAPESASDASRAESRSSGMANPHASPLDAAGKVISIGPRPHTAPMIVRTVDLAIEVRELTSARAAVEQTLTRHGGFINTLQTTEGEDLTATLHVPAEELDATLKDLRLLGKVTHETQSGEDVSAQHQDLEARLRTARITEARFQDILTRRTGSVSDVLEVEQEIERVRGEIEEMEGEEKGLIHRVTYSTITLTLTQQTKPEPPTTVSHQLRQALTNGLHNLGDSLLSLTLFLEEDGLTLLFWAAIPAFFLYRRYRRYRNNA